VHTRHQVSTDITSVAKREFSITKALDFTAKFLRGTLDPYIGRFNITPEFINYINAILFASGMLLTRDFVLGDFKVLSVVQSSINPDTLEIEVSVLPLFPANYIKIKLIFSS
jgi:hypothetical protein